MRYVLNLELEALGKKLIGANADLENLKVLKIGYMFREEASIIDGGVIAGKAIRVDDRNWTIHKTDVLIEIARDVWDEASEDFKNALMDHELHHPKVVLDEEQSPVMEESTGRIKVIFRRHDIEEFAIVLERHGAYHESLRKFLEAFAVNKAQQKKAKKAGMTSGSLDD